MKSVEDYADHLKMLNRREATIKRYVQVINSYLEHSKGEVSEESARKYLVHKTKQGVGGTNRRLIYYSLLSFLHFKDPKFTEFSFPLPKLDEPKQPAFTEIEIMKMLDKAKFKCNRDYLILRLLAMTGIRKGSLPLIDPEIKGLITKTREGYILNVIKSKTDSYKTPIDQETVHLLLHYKPCKKGSHPFATREKAPWQLGTDAVSKVVMYYKKLCGIKKERAGTHAFRRGYITIRRKKGADIKSISEDAGHKSVAQTLRYDQPSLEDRGKSYKETLPGA